MVTGELSRVAPYRCFFSDSFSLPGVPFHDVMKQRQACPLLRLQATRGAIGSSVGSPSPFHTLCSCRHPTHMHTEEQISILEKIY